MRPAWVNVNLTNLRKNIKNLKKLLKSDTIFMGVIKADGYGHGAIKLAETLRKENIDHFAVAILQEGIELRHNGFQERILILGYTPEEDYGKLLEYKLTPTLYSYQQAEYLNRKAQEVGSKIKIHIKVDTGMNRIGFLPTETTISEIKKIADLPNILIEGIFSHLAIADQPQNEFTLEQFKRFSSLIKQLEEGGVKIPIKHIANSAATINFPEMHLDLVRPGISLYGLYPDPSMAINPKVELYPVMEVKAKLVHVKTVPENTPVSYGCTFITNRRTRIGTIPMGYADGVFRLLSNQGEVIVNGRRCPIIGRVCMDQFMVDLTDVPEARVGDEVVFMGRQGEEFIGADEIAEKVDTINYEVVSRVGKRLPRYYID